ncbi:MAG: glutamate synthase large subunit, partial [Planctomycetota bacterium]
ESMRSAFALVHQRYSTNTFPTWPLAQPFRMLGHNGEINTLRGNINNMRARYASMRSDRFGENLADLYPVVIEGGSDSASFDNVLEFLTLTGRSLPHAMMMMVPQAWGAKYYMGQDRRAFYEYHSMVMEPWDGPAALVATDGVRVCATLDRNGLRPSRYVVTTDNQIILGSEIGVLEVPPEQAEAKGRLGPGKLLVVDTERGRLLHDEEIKAEVCRQRPYRRWVAANRIELRGLFDGLAPVHPDRETLFQRQTAFGYTREDLSFILAPMCSEGKEPIGSMGDDTPLAVLSDEPQLLFNYFKQLFAQVTNPAIDPIREELVMSLTTYLGAHHNLLDETPEHARMLKLRTPVLTNDDLHRIRTLGQNEFRSVTLEMLFDADRGGTGLQAALDRLCADAEEAVKNGSAVVILSDRNLAPERAPIPSLLAASAVNHHLVRMGIRTEANVVIESGEPREVEHFALLLGYGASAVNPYVALETIAVMAEDKELDADLSVQSAVEKYISAIEKGLLKIFSKMGISTLRSYRGAQIFECLGLAPELVDRYFTATASRIGGLGMDEVAREALLRHTQAHAPRRTGPQLLRSGGRYSLRRDGERHLWTPDSIRFLQQATRTDDRGAYDRFAASINGQERRHCTLRSLFTFDDASPISVDEVEPAEAIMKRFVTGAMSFGSISREAHESMAIALNRIGGRSNSGEGGEDPERFKPMPNGDSRCSATKQVASGRFGVTAEYLANATEIQIKIAQGAKPGEGGHLPGHKVNVEIASVRHSTPGVSLISPPPHHDIYSIEDLAQLIFDLKNANPAARINVKLVSEVGVGTVAAGVSKGHADALLISGGDGGTGASPISSIKYAGLPWELGLSETHQVLVKNDLRGRITVQTDGQMRTGRDVAVAALLGAEEYGFATAALIVLGCVMMRKCQKNTCPVGVATQDPRLRKRFCGSPDYLVNYFRFIAEELREIMAELGFRTVDEMIGRADKLRPRDGIDHWKARTLDFSAILHRPEEADRFAVHKVQEQDHGIDAILDRKLIAAAQPALDEGTRVELAFDIHNTDRTTGAMLSGEVAKRFGHAGLPDDTITLRFTGSAGQSFAAFGARGLTFVLDGDSNDYIGKGLSGGRIIVRTPEKALFPAHENVIIGNVALYGAIEGEAYFNGLAG